MKIVSFEIVGLFGRAERVRAKFDPEMNIITGRNGAGKTSVLKLMWYIISGNIEVALSEVDFKRATIVTDSYKCRVTRINRVTCKIEFTPRGDSTTIYEDIQDSDGDVVRNAQDEPNELMMETGSSVFFPTFRRIEGGYTLTAQRPVNRLTGRIHRKNAVEEALSDLARRLTNANHNFVSAISTGDIVGLLLRQYADLSEAYNKVQAAASQEIIETIKAHKSDREDLLKAKAANTILDNIRARIERMEKERENIMTPIEAVRKVVERLFLHTGIQIDTRLNFGDAASAVNSDLLSAGEKQMLSFICYNAFYRNAIIFIDEPELSLHVDWQRQLFSILKQQQSNNQFIVATHSPFMHSKYPDKEIPLNVDRGDSERQDG